MEILSEAEGMRESTGKCNFFHCQSSVSARKDKESPQHRIDRWKYFCLAHNRNLCGQVTFTGIVASSPGWYDAESSTDCGQEFTMFLRIKVSRPRLDNRPTTPKLPGSCWKGLTKSKRFGQNEVVSRYKF